MYIQNINTFLATAYLFQAGYPKLINEPANNIIFYEQSMSKQSGSTSLHTTTDVLLYDPYVTEVHHLLYFALLAICLDPECFYIFNTELSVASGNSIHK